MIGYTSLGTADLARATAFYDPLLAELAAKQIMAFDDFIVWANAAAPRSRSMSPKTESPILSAMA